MCGGGCRAGHGGGGRRRVRRSVGPGRSWAVRSRVAADGVSGRAPCGSATAESGRPGDGAAGGDAAEPGRAGTAACAAAARGGEQRMVPEAEFTLVLRPAGRQGAGVAVGHRRVPVHRRARRRVGAAGRRAPTSPAGRRCAGPAGSPRLGAVGASVYFLVDDLGRPERFHHMLRVAKPTSPMSVGHLDPHRLRSGRRAGRRRRGRTAAAGARRARAGASTAAAGRAGRRAGRRRRRAGAGHLHRGAARPTRPCRPGTRRTRNCRSSSRAARWPAAPASGCSPRRCAQAGPARRMAVAGAALELCGGPLGGDPAGPAQRALPAGHGGSAAARRSPARPPPGWSVRWLGRRSRVVSALSGTALLAASVATRFGIFHGGVASARDPKYTVLPQRERIRRRESGQV